MKLLFCTKRLNILFQTRPKIGALRFYITMDGSLLNFKAAGRNFPIRHWVRPRTSLQSALCMTFRELPSALKQTIHCNVKQLKIKEPPKILASELGAQGPPGAQVSYY